MLVLDGMDQERHLQVAAEGEPCWPLGAGIMIGEIAELGEKPMGCAYSALSYY